MTPIAVRISVEEEALVLEVLRSGQLVQGAFVERFERDERNVLRESRLVADGVPVSGIGRVLVW